MSADRSPLPPPERIAQTRRYMAVAIGRAPHPLSQWALLVKELGARTVVELHRRGELAAQLAQLAEEPRNAGIRAQLLEFEEMVREADGVPAVIVDPVYARLEVGLAGAAGYAFNAPGGLG